MNRLSDAEKARRTAALAKELNVKTTAEKKSGYGLVIEQAARDLDEMQKANLRLVHIAAQENRLRVVLRDEIGGGKGNAAYNSATNVIYLDTGAEGLYTKYLSHELVHYIKRNNVSGYQALEQLFDYYAENMESYDVNERIDARIAEYKRQGVELSREAAKEELVADSVLDMIADKQRVMDAYAMNKTLFSQIKDWVEKQLANIRRMLEKARDGSPEAKLMTQTEERYKFVKGVFEEVLLEASTNARIMREVGKYKLSGLSAEYAQDLRKAMDDKGRVKALRQLAHSMLEKSGNEVTQENVRALAEAARKMQSGESKGSYTGMVRNAGLKGWDADNKDMNYAFAVLGEQMEKFDEENIRYSLKTEERYDYSKPFSQQVDDWMAGKIPQYDTLLVGRTPELYRQIGLSDLPVVIDQTHVNYAVNGTKDENHHMGADMLKQLPDLLKNPIAVIESSSKPQDSVVAIAKAQVNGHQTIAAVKINGVGANNEERLDVNFVTSVHGRENAVTKLLTEAIKKENTDQVGVYYWNKVEARSLFGKAGVQFPSVSMQDGLIHSIHDAGSPVNRKYLEQTETHVEL